MSRRVARAEDKHVMSPTGERCLTCGVTRCLVCGDLVPPQTLRVGVCATCQAVPLDEAQP